MFLFHVVFTIPDSLNRIALINQRIVYDILFKAASETLLALARDGRHLGAEIGFIILLQSQSQDKTGHMQKDIEYDRKAG